MKFKVGDKVRIKGGTNQVGWNDEMLKYIGTYGILESIDSYSPNLCVTLNLDDEDWWFNKEDLELVESSHEIHITTKGTTTHAIMKENGKIVKRVEAKLHPDDEFNFEKGVELCIDRLFGKECAKVEECKREFDKAKVGDKIKIVNAGGYHIPFVKNGDEFIIETVGSCYIGTKYNSFFDSDKEYIIIPNTTIDLSTVSTDDLLSEIKRRMK